MDPDDAEKQICDRNETTQELRITCRGPCQNEPLSDTGNRLQLLKMLCLTVIPILGLWGFSVYTLTDIINKKTENEKTKFELHLSVELGKLIHHLQQERDMSVLYLSDLGPGTKTFLLTEYIATDKAIYALSEWPADLDNKKRSEFESKSKLQEHLSFHRQLLSKDTYDLHNEVEFYTNIIDVVIVWLYQSITRGQFAVVWKTLVAYLKLTSGKQDIGIERALGTLFYVQGGFKSQTYFEMYNNRINRFKAFYTTAELYSNRVDRLYTSGVKMVEANITGIINNFRYEIQHHNNDDVHPDMEKARYWFDNMTIYLDTLLDIQRNLGYEIIDILDVVIRETTRDLSVSAAFLCVVLIMCPLVIYITENLTSRIQRYAVTLLEKTRELGKEKIRTDGFLYQMVPKFVADKIKMSMEFHPEYFQSVTILFIDIFGFDRISTECTPREIVVLMNSLYGRIDEIVLGYNVYKVETIRECYMVASGLLTRNDDNHVAEIADLALQTLHMIQTKRFSVSGNRYVQLLIGINTGPCMTGVVGAIMPKYCVVGDTVNMASEIKTNGSPNRIHIAESTNLALKKHGSFVTRERGVMTFKGKVPIKTFWLLGRADSKHRLQYESSEMDEAQEQGIFNGIGHHSIDSSNETIAVAQLRDDRATARIHPSANAPNTETADHVLEKL